METTVNATTDFLKETINKYEVQVKQLEEHIQQVTRRMQTEASERNIIRNEMHEWTLESLDEGAIEESQAEEIAMICGFELTKEFEVEVTVTYSVTVNARNAEQAEMAISDIDFDSVSYNDDSVAYLSSNVESIDI